MNMQSCPQIIITGKSSDTLDYEAMSHTYHTRNNPQPTTFLPPSQFGLPPLPHLSQNIGLGYDLASQVHNALAKI